MPKETYIFQRIEKKYILTEEQKSQLFSAISSKICGDEFGKSTICSAYFDTPDYRLIRNSIDAKAYKEKLRLRSYGSADPDGYVFLELKKKYKSVVYKRRISLKYSDAMDYIYKGIKPQDSQIMREIDYSMRFYGYPQPRSVISYEREAFFVNDLPALRITFDTNVRYRNENLELTHPTDGKLILPRDITIMEIKTDGSMPIWLSRELDRCDILPSSFSKYGRAYLEFSRAKNSPDMTPGYALV